MNSLLPLIRFNILPITATIKSVSFIVIYSQFKIIQTEIYIDK